jgi:O-antigen biosynthesis protein
MNRKNDDLYQLACQRMDEILKSPWLTGARQTVRQVKDRFSREMIAFALVDTAKKEGISHTLKKMKNLPQLKKLRKERYAIPQEYDYNAWLQHSPKNDAIKEFTLRKKEAMGILLSAHLENVEFMMDSIKSLLDQSYSNWILYIVGSQEELQSVKNILEQNKINDSRIKIGQFDKSITYVGFLNAGDVLQKEAIESILGYLQNNEAAEIAYTDEDKIESDGFRFEHFFKPDWSPDLLLNYNYVGHFFVIKSSLLDDNFGEKSWTEAEYYDMVLKSTERAKHVLHIPKVLYNKRNYSCEENQLASNKEEMREVVRKALKRRGIPAIIKSGLVYDVSFRVKYKLQDKPLISIIIPSGGRWDLLSRCIKSIRELPLTRTSYDNLEIIVVYHGSHFPKEFLKIAEEYEIKLAKYPDPRYAFGKMNNFGGRIAKGEYLVLLNDDTEAISQDWIESMLEYSQQKGVGMVGAKLVYQDGSLGHAGDLILRSGQITHILKGLPEGGAGYHGFANVARNVSCVTAACLMVKKELFTELGGFDERFTSYDDVDLCLRAMEKGYKNIYTPYAVVLHHETGTRKGEINAIEEYRSLIYLRLKHPTIFEEGDPFYNPNLDQYLQRQFMLPEIDLEPHEFSKISMR